MTLAEHDPQPGAVVANDDDLNAGATPIRTAASASIPGKASVASGEAGSVRVFVNDQLNSRLVKPVGQSKWTLRLAADIDPQPGFSYLLHTGERIVLGGLQRWQMLSMAGKPIATGKIGPGEIVLDPQEGVLLLPDPYGTLEAYSLADGAVRYSVSIEGSDEKQRAFFARRGHRLVVTSFERQINPHATEPPNTSTIEVMDLGEKRDIQSGVLASGKQEVLHYYEAPRIVSALLGNTLVAAVRNHVLVTDFGGAVRANFSGDFKPGAISLDETGRIYLLVSVNGRLALWVLTPKGERVVAYEFPPEQAIKPIAPVVGYDHRVFYYTGGTVIAIGPDGKLLWEKPTGGAVAGIAVSADDQLLVAAGSRLLAFNVAGESRVLAEFQGETLKTTPTISSDGDLLVASQRKLYRLSPGK